MVSGILLLEWSKASHVQRMSVSYAEKDLSVLFENSIVPPHELLPFNFTTDGSLLFEDDVEAALNMKCLHSTELYL